MSESIQPQRKAQEETKKLKVCCADCFEPGENMPIVLVNPLDETPRRPQAPAPRLKTLAGKTLGLLDISKPGGNLFLDHLERLLKERFDVGRIVRAMKPTFSKPAPDEVLDGLVAAKCDAVIEALAD